MRKALLLILLAGGSAVAEEGASLFVSKGCASCHPPRKEGMGPSLERIAEAYAGKREDLIRYLKGQGPAIVDPSRDEIMRAQLTMISGLSDEQISAIADFILSYGQDR